MNEGPPSDRQDLERRQAKALRHMLRVVMRDNPFYRAKLSAALAAGPPSIAELPSLPLTDKRELAEDQAIHAPFGTNLTFPIEEYSRLHSTSGTTSQPMRWLDTPDSWRWFIDCWKAVFRAAGVNRSDRLYFAFSFGPFIGFWAAFEAAHQIGALAISGGASTTDQRLDHLLHYRATGLVSTPTYAIHLAERARQKGLDLASSQIRLTLHAGEPGASLPNIRSRIEEAFGARAYDHAGATEVGPWGVPGDRPDTLRILESQFIAEVVCPQTGDPVEADSDGRLRGELVLTNLGRLGSPVIRYRTGDCVELEREASGEPPVARLIGGVTGRVDDMLVVRGVNVYPSAIENLVREIPGIDEFEVRAVQHDSMTELEMRVEVIEGDPATEALRLSDLLRDRLHLRVEIETVEPGTLPRWELKARRFHDDRPRR